MPKELRLPIKLSFYYHIPSEETQLQVPLGKEYGEGRKLNQRKQSVLCASWISGANIWRQGVVSSLGATKVTVSLENTREA